MTIDPFEKPMQAHEIAEHAAKFVKWATDSSGLSTLQLIAVFGASASVCSELANAQQRAYMIGRMLNVR